MNNLFRTLLALGVALTVSVSLAAQAGPEELARLQQVAALIKAKRGIEIEDIALLCKMEYKEALLYTGMLESEGIIYTDLLGRCSIVFKNA